MNTARALASSQTETGFAEGPHAIGIDVGGTKIAGAIVNLNAGTIAARRQIATDYHRGGAAILEDVAALADDLLAQAARLGMTPRALGVAVAELVDPQGQIFSDHLIKWKGVDVQALLSKLAPTTVESDVRAAALAEARHGAGARFRDFFYVSIGTGISGVLVQAGVPYAGSRGGALVIANGSTRHHCLNCGHVSTGIVEDIASGPGIAKAFGPGETGQTVLAAADAGDDKAIRLIDHATEELGRVISLLVNSLDPAAMILGGGLGSAPGRYFESLGRSIRAGLWASDQRLLPILQADLGVNAGIIGAALSTTIRQEPGSRPST